MSIWKKLQARNQRCRICETDFISGLPVDKFPDLKLVKPLKFGHLYQCSKCGRSWFLPEHKKWLSRIHDAFLPLVHQWDQNRFTIHENILNVLVGIGGAEEYYKGYITIPCAIQNISGQKIEKGLVWISKQPPFRWPDPNLVHWSTELVKVASSPFSLPLAVRRASSEKREEAMGFSPVGVVDKAGTEYTLGCESHFFDRNGVKGEEISLSGRPKKWRNVIWPEPAQAYYFVDWFDHCEELLASREPA
jgi:hypothetical protein